MAAIVEGVGHDAGEIPQPPRPDLMVEALRVAEAAIATTRKVLDDVLCRVQLRLHAWQTIRDPATRSWLDETRHSAKDGTASAGASTREDILRAIEKSAGQR